MLLIFLSSLIPETKDSGKEVSVSGAGSIVAGEYEREIEERLTAAISRIGGAGEVWVMVSLSDTGETDYLTDTEETRTEEGEKREEKRSEKAVVVSGEAVVTQTAAPKVAGVAVVCEGGGAAAVQEKIYALIHALYGLPSTRVSISS